MIFELLPFSSARTPALGLDPTVAFGPPEDIVKEPRSYTGQFLKPVLAKKSNTPKKRRAAVEGVSEAAE